MNFRNLTHNDAGNDVRPRTREDWDEWVSATKLRGYLVGNTLGDWLDLYGETNGFEKDAPLDPRLDFLSFVKERGIEFERAVVAHLAERADLVRIAGSWSDSQNLDKVEETLAALAAGREIVHQGVLWNPASRTYGTPDFLVRSDVFDRLFPDHLEPREAERPAPGLDRPWHYLVVDAKFRTLRLSAEPKPGRKPRKGSRPGEVGNDGSSPAYKAQLFVYNAALARLQGYEPTRAFLLGRRWEQTRQGFAQRGSNAMERLGPVSIDSDLGDAVRPAISWVRQVRALGGTWRVLPEPTRSELRPPAPGDVDWPWKGAIREITDRLEDPIRLWQVGAGKRDDAVANGITSWRHPSASPGSLGVKGPTTAPVLQAILDVNRTEGPLVRPSRVNSAQEQWRERPVLEFFVDFETVSDVDDDFSQFPRRGGQSMIFMIGCGHMENGEWRFECFIANRLDEVSEARALDDWFRHMANTSDRLGWQGPKAPTVFHWSSAEQSTLETAYNAARVRHPERDWPHPNWFDLLSRVVKKEPVVVKNAFGFGLKEMAKALHSHGLIETSWDDSPVDGQGAMVGAWHCDREAAERGIGLCEADLMKEIRDYNEVDCRVMQEILYYLWANH